MIRKECRLVVGDNSDAKLVLCIHPNKKNTAYRKTSLANFVKVTIKKKVSRRKNIKHRVNWCLIGSTKKRLRRASGESIRFARSKAVLVDEKRRKVMGTLIKGVLPRELCGIVPGEIIARAKQLV